MKKRRALAVLLALVMALANVGGMTGPVWAEVPTYKPEYPEEPETEYAERNRWDGSKGRPP